MQKGILQSNPKEVFELYLKELDSIIEIAKQIKVTSVEQSSEMQLAKETRLKLRKIRTNAEKKRKEIKQVAIDYGRKIDEIYKDIENRIKPTETYLKSQEDFIQAQRASIEEQKTNERIELLGTAYKYVDANVNVGKISKKRFNEILAQAKSSEEANRIALERAERIESVRAAKFAEWEAEQARGVQGFKVELPKDEETRRALLIEKLRCVLPVGFETEKGKKLEKNVGILLEKIVKYVNEYKL